MPYILRVIVQEATVYFLIIFSSHFVLEMFLLFANVSISFGDDRCGVEKFSSRVCSSYRVREYWGFTYQRTQLNFFSCSSIISGNSVCVLNDLGGCSRGVLVHAHKTNSAYRYLPVMINRLILSLKKAADTSEAGWSSRGISHASKRPHDLEFAQIPDEDTLSFTEEDAPDNCFVYDICVGDRESTDGDDRSLSVMETNDRCKHSDLAGLRPGIYSCLQDALTYPSILSFSSCSGLSSSSFLSIELFPAAIREASLADSGSILLSRYIHYDDATLDE